MEIKNKSIIITGASSGIGKELAIILSSKGGLVSLLSRRKEEIEKLANEISRNNENVIAIQTDVTSSEQVNDAIKQTTDKFGKIDIVINNAGLGCYAPIELMPNYFVEQIFKTNIIGALNVVKASLPYLKITNGMIVNISSGLSKRALPYLSAYAGTKAMLNMISDGLRMELKPFDIKVLTYLPPQTKTSFAECSLKAIPIDSSSKFDARASKPEDVAGRIVKAIIKEKREVVEGKMLDIMNFFFPKFLDNVFYKAMVLKNNHKKS